MDIQTSASRPASGPSFDNYTRRPLRTVTECAQSLVDSVASTSAAEDAERLPPRFYLIPITIESGPARGSTRICVKPTSFIHVQHCAPV